MVIFRFSFKSRKNVVCENALSNDCKQNILKNNHITMQLMFQSVFFLVSYGKALALIDVENECYQSKGH